MALGRLIKLVDGEPNSIIRLKWLTKIFSHRGLRVILHTIQRRRNTGGRNSSIAAYWRENNCHCSLHPDTLLRNVSHLRSRLPLSYQPSSDLVDCLVFLNVYPLAPAHPQPLPHKRHHSRPKRFPSRRVSYG